MINNTYQKRREGTIVRLRFFFHPVLVVTFRHLAQGSLLTALSPLRVDATKYHNSPKITATPHISAQVEQKLCFLTQTWYQNFIRNNKPNNNSIHQLLYCQYNNWCIELLFGLLFLIKNRVISLIKDYCILITRIFFIRTIL